MGKRGSRAGVGWTLAVLALGCGVTGGPRLPMVAPDLEAGTVLESTAAQVDEKPGDVTLRFAWPSSISGRCATIARRIEKQGTQVIRAAHSVRAEPDGGQLRVETFDVEVPADAPAAVRPLAETWHAEVLVDGQGRLLRAQSLDPALDADMRGMVTTRLAERWQLLVGAWAGRTLPIDSTYTATAPQQTSAGPVRLRITVRADGRVP